MIVKQSVVDVLMFLFERYLDDEEASESNHFTEERDSIQLRLKEVGFQNHEINQAFDWLESLVDYHHNNQMVSLKETSTRIYSEQEKKLISLESIGFLNFLEQSDILTPVTRELILDRVVALGHSLDAQQLKWIIMIVLHSHPGEKNTLALMEDFMFDETIDHIH